MITDAEDTDATNARSARRGYEEAIQVLIKRLHPKDFELLVDLILHRSGWIRTAKLGGSVEGIDVEAENAAIDERAFVQVKSTADEGVLEDYINRFSARRDRYHRMIFAVHTSKDKLVAPIDLPVQVWTSSKIAALVVKHGLGDWVSERL